MKSRVGVKFILLIGCLIFLASCSRERIYEGDYPELFSVAIHSLLGVRGYEFGHGGEPWIQILDEDDYGRVLFLYLEESAAWGHLIMQKVDGDYAYFYPHYNFILLHLEERTDELKEMNNWNQPMSDVSEFERVPIVRQKESGPISDELLIEVYHEIFLGVSLGRRRNAAILMQFLRTDHYGRSVYIGEGADSQWRGVRKVVFFQPDHSFDLETGVLEIRDMNNYQTELRLFMEANGWNEPWEE